MKAIKYRYGTVNALVKSFEAGNDISIMRFNEKDEEKAILKIYEMVNCGSLNKYKINMSVKRIINIKEKYGMTQARIIANSLFDLVDPNMTCVKRRSNDSSAKNYYLLSNGNFKEYMRKAIIKSLIVNKITKSSESSYSSYMSIANDAFDF